MWLTKEHYCTWIESRKAPKASFHYVPKSSAPPAKTKVSSKSPRNRMVVDKTEAVFNSRHPFSEYHWKFQVKLPALPKSFSQALKQYNKHVQQTFSYYLETLSEYVDKENGGHDRVLPLSGIGMFFISVPFHYFCMAWKTGDFARVMHQKWVHLSRDTW